MWRTVRQFQYGPDPEAYAVDAFTFSWSDITFYAFPPFSIIPQVLQKIVADRATGLLVVPNWPSSIWFSQFNRLLISDRIVIPSSREILRLPNQPLTLHPLHKTLRLIAGIVSGIKD